MSKILLNIIVVIACLSLYGCGTLKGIGEDITSLGGFISDGSDHYKEAVGDNPPGSKMGENSNIVQ